MVSTVIEIANVYFKPQDIVFISHSRGYDEINDMMVTKFHQETTFPIMVMHPSNVMSRRPEANMTSYRFIPKQFIFIIQNSEDIEFHSRTFLTFLRNTVEQDVTGLYLIVARQRQVNMLEITGTFLSIYFIHNAVIIVPVASEQIDLYTWYPFQYTQQCGKFYKMIKICRFNHSAINYNELNIFSPKIPRNFKYYPIYINAKVRDDTAVPIFMLQVALLKELVFSHLQISVCLDPPTDVFVDIIAGGNQIIMEVKFRYWLHPQILQPRSFCFLFR